MNNLRQKTTSGILWSFLDKAGSQLAGFVITILLARMLSPTDFGLVAMATAFFAISRIFIDAGLRDSLIQKKDAGQVDFNTVFYFNIAVGLVIYLIIFFTAPFVASFYNNADLTLLIRVLAVNVVVHSFSIVHLAILTKELKFKSLLKARIPAVILSGLTALLLAFNDFGVWALVTQIVLESALFNLFLWRLAKWIPTGSFERHVFEFHWRHGSRLLLGESINIIYRNIFSLVIGKFFSPAQLGLYNRADSFIVVTYNNTVGLVQTVSYPALAHLQDQLQKLKTSYRKILQFTLLGTLPIYLLLMLQSREIIEILLTRKWAEAAPILTVLSMAAVFAPFNSINLNILKVKRRTDLFLRLQIISKSAFIVIVICTAFLGFDYLIYTNLIGATLLLFINNFFTNRLIHYSTREQLRDLFPLVMAFSVSYLLVNAFISNLRLFDSLILNLAGNALLTGVTFYSVIFVIRRSMILEGFSVLRELAARNAN